MHLDHYEIVDFLKKHDKCFTPRISEKVDLRQYAMKLSRSAVHFIVKEKEELVGLAACYFNDYKSKKGFLSFVSIDPSYQGKGLGKKLLIEIIEYGKTKGFAKLELEVDDSNKHAIRFYQLLGFGILNHNARSIIMNRDL